MKLVNLKVAGLRGFNEYQDIDLDGNLVIYTGPNGSGKSSIGEVIEWGFFGCTLRRIKGDEISKREYAGSYRNTHYKGAEAPFVEIMLQDIHKQNHTIKRELNEDETSTLIVDGKKQDDLKEFGIRDIFDRPLILQDTLHDFIYMKPKSRYEVLSAMLGLEELIVLRSAIEEAKNGLPGSYPREVLDGIYKVKPLLSQLETIDITKPVVEAVKRNATDAAYEQLVAISQGRISITTETGDILADLKSEKALKQRKQLDWGRFSFSFTPVEDDHPLKEDTIALEEGVDSINKKIGELVLKIASSKKQDKDVTNIEFLRLGLALINTSAKAKCPFCLEETLTAERLREIKDICSESPELSGELRDIKQQIADYQAVLSRHWQNIISFLPKFPESADEQKILDLLGEKDRKKISFLTELDNLKRIIKKLGLLKDGLSENLELAKKKIDTKIETGEEYPDIPKALNEYLTSLNNMAHALNAYAKQYAAIDPRIKSQISSGTEVALLEKLIQCLENWNDILFLKYLDNIQDGLQELIRKIREFIGEKQKQILGERDREIRSWYDLMNQGANVGYHSILPKTDFLELQARTFDKMMMASPNLSTAQLNCVGLAIALACATRQNSPYQFILIDDPIQSMDDDHTEAFKGTVIKKLLEANFQVILMTQMPKFADKVEALYRNSYSKVHLYNIKNYQSRGPAIVYGGPVINQILDNVKLNKDAPNEQYRASATQSLRKFVERFVKDLYICQTGKSIAKKYENEAWPRLRKLLRQCKSFEVTDEPSLKDTHDFTSPYLHTDDTIGKKVPSSHQLNPHYDKMSKMLSKYGKTLGVKK
jgi:DNA repair exonuclease SbcCD ATPase subunit